VLLLLVVWHLPGGAPIDGVRACDTDGLQDALEVVAAAVGGGDEAAGVSVTRVDEARRAPVLVRQLIMAS
jgi:hypothetical protein